jgi:hypothetical protein
MDNFTENRLASPTPSRARRALHARGARDILAPRSTKDLHWEDRFAKNAESVTPRQSRWFASLMGVAAVAIIAQAAIAGQFVAHPGSAGWILAHGLISYATLATTLAAAVFTVAKLRRSQRIVTALTVGLFGLAVAQTIIGYLVTAGIDALLIVHIPLAFIVFGLAGWLSVKATALTTVSHRRFRG